MIKCRSFRRLVHYGTPSVVRLVKKIISGSRSGDPLGRPRAAATAPWFRQERA